MLAKLAVWYLRKNRRSVLIGYNIIGGYIIAKDNNAFIHNNNLIDVECRDSDNKLFDLPEGQFSYRRKRFD